MAVEQGYKGLELGNGYPFLASYFINVAESGRMFQRVPNGWAKLDSKVEYLMAMFKSSTIYFHVVGKHFSGTSPFVSRTCVMDMGRFQQYVPIRYLSYIDIQFRFVRI